MLYTVKNLTRGTTLGHSIEIAGSSAERRSGLLRREFLPDGAGLWIAPSEAVHTFFMAFAIDIVFLDRAYRVRKITPALKPWRLAACLSAHSVLELPAGAALRSSTGVGDQLFFEKREP